MRAFVFYLALLAFASTYAASCVGANYNFTCDNVTSAIINESCTFDGNITFSGPNDYYACFYLDGDNIDVNGAGHTIRITGRGVAFTMYTSARNNVSLHDISIIATNETISGWSTYAVTTFGRDFNNLHFYNINITDISNGYMGAIDTTGTNQTFENIRIANTMSGIASAGNNNNRVTIRNCVFLNEVPGVGNFAISTYGLMLAENNYMENFYYGIAANRLSEPARIINNTIVNSTEYGIYVGWDGARYAYFENNTNNIEYNGTDLKFEDSGSDNDGVNTSSRGNLGWWPLLASNGSDVDSNQSRTAWYNGSAGGRNADGSPNITLHSWYNRSNVWGCISPTRVFVCGEIVNESCVMNIDLDINGSTCFTIGADNITVDCDGYSISGNNTRNRFGIYSNRTNTTVTGCSISQFDTAIFYYNSSYGAITNNTVVATTTSIWPVYPPAVLLSNGASFNTLSNNLVYSQYGIAIYLRANSSNNTISAVTAHSNGSKVLYLNSSSGNAISNSTFFSSQSARAVHLYSSSDNLIYECNCSSQSSDALAIESGSSRNSVSNTSGWSYYSDALYLASSSNNNTFYNFSGFSHQNVALFLRSSSNNKITNSFAISRENAGVELRGTSNDLVINSTVVAYSYSAFQLDGTTNTTLINSTGQTFSNYYGVEIYGSNNTLINCLGNSTGGAGIYDSAENTTIINSTGYSVSDSGIELDGSNTAIINSTGVSNQFVGLYLWGATGCRLINSVASSNSSVGLRIDRYSTSNLFMNSNFSSNLSYGVRIVYNSSGNLFINCTNSKEYSGLDQKFYSESGSGSNISSYGNLGWWPLLGSNGSDANTQSMTAWYNGTSGGRNADGSFNPVLNSWYNSTNPVGCIGQTRVFVCGQIVNESCIMNWNLGINGSTCFTIGADNVTVDCAGYSIAGNNTILTNGIYTNRFNSTIKNCNINGFGVGINFNAANSGTVENNNVSTTISFADPIYYSAILLYNGSSGNRLNNNNLYSRFGSGIYLYSSPSNTITNFVATTNSSIPLLFFNSPSNTITNSTLASNGTDGLVLVLSSNNLFINCTNSPDYNGTAWRLYSSANNLFINCTNSLDYNGIEQKFYSDSAQNTSSSGNVGWWPLPCSDGSDAAVQNMTAWYNGTFGGRNADGNPNPSLHSWHALAGCNAPQVVLTRPANSSTFEGTSSRTLRWNASDDFDLNMSCLVYLDGLNIANLTAANNTESSVQSGTLTLDWHYWNVTCWDLMSNFGESQTWAFRVVRDNEGPRCGDSVCNTNEDCSTCPDDCGECGPECGDGSCDGNENCTTCQGDCGSCPQTQRPCGDGYCNAGENCSTCPDDCGSCLFCGDGSCNGNENCSVCDRDCGPCQLQSSCGDGSCNGQETCSNCESDCGNCDVCGDGSCTSGESCSACPEDCGPCQQNLNSCQPDERCDLNCFSDPDCCYSNAECPSGQVCTSGRCVPESGAGCSFNNPKCDVCFSCVNNACVELYGWGYFLAPLEVPVNTTVEVKFLNEGDSPVPGTPVSVSDPFANTNRYITNSQGKITYIPDKEGYYTYSLECFKFNISRTMATSAYNPNAIPATRTIIIPLYVPEPSKLTIDVISLGKPMQADIRIKYPLQKEGSASTDSAGRYQQDLTESGKYVFTISAQNVKSLAATIDLTPLPAAANFWETPWLILLLFLLLLIFLAHLVRKYLLGKKTQP